MNTTKKYVNIDEKLIQMVSLMNTGQIHFTCDTVNRFNLYKYAHVTFIYNEKIKYIGMLFGEQGRIELKKQQTELVADVKKFLDYHKITYSKTKKYLLHQIASPDFFYINLNED